MTRNKLNKIRRKIEELRDSSAKANDIQRLAKQLGRVKIKRGKEPTWVSAEFGDALRPLSIPDHGGRDFAPGTKHAILNHLEDDVNAWDEKLTQQEKESRGR
jgi:hypothetical protein